MPFDISKFNAEGTGYGFVRPAHFLAAIPQPPKWYRGNTRFLSYLCSSSNLPGAQITTSEERGIGYGPTRKVPYDVVHSDVTMTFYLDGNAESLSFFDQWLRNVVAFGNPDKSDPINGASWGEVQYPAHYETQIQLYVYNENPGLGEDEMEILKYTLDKAYPVNITDVTLDWANGESIQVFQVTFAFKTFWMEKNKATRYGTGGPPMQKDPDYLARAHGKGTFDAQNEFARYAHDYAQSKNPGFIGLPGLSQIVGFVSGVYASVQDKITAINGYASQINGQLQSIGALASLGRSSSNPLTVPQIGGIHFP